jgi:hypothetical protein
VDWNWPPQQMTSSELLRRKAEREHQLGAPEVSPDDRKRWQDELDKVNEQLDQLRKTGAIR